MNRSLQILSADPEYSKLHNGNLRAISEGRSVNVITSHFAALPQEEKLEELLHWRRIRPRFLSHTFLAALVTMLRLKGSLRPITALASMSQRALRLLELEAKRQSDRTWGKILRKKRSALNSELRKMRKLRKRVSRLRRKAQK